MPRRSDLKSVLVIGSGPIVIGQGCEFDYSGTQACRVLKAEGNLGIFMANLRYFKEALAKLRAAGAGA